jgi:hypothetical protein
MREKHPPLVHELLRRGAVIVSVTETAPSPATKSPVSPGFIPFSVNVHKAKTAVMSGAEYHQRETFLDYLETLTDKRVLVHNLADGSLAKLVKPSDASRYFPGGRKRIRAKIYKRLGRWFNCCGYLLTLTFDPKLISRVEAWHQAGLRRREFMRRVNIWRQRHGMPKARVLSVIEEQPGTGYPHVHMVFPYLKWLAPIEFLTEIWGQAPNSVDYKVKDSMSPVSYICKYISKMDGWSDLALSYLWANRTRLYSMSRDYTIPDYSDKRVPEWAFRRCMSKTQAKNLMATSLGGYDTLLGADDLISEMLPGGIVHEN